MPSRSHKQQIGMDLSAMAAVATYHRLSDLARIYFLPLPEAGHPRSRCWQCLVLRRLVDGCLLHLHVHFLLWAVCILISSPQEDTSHLGLSPTLMTPFHLITTLKTLSPNTVAFPSNWGYDFNRCIWGEHSSAPVRGQWQTPTPQESSGASKVTL